MRRILLIVPVIVLIACQKPAVGQSDHLDAKQVLERAARASQSLKSARYVVNGNFTITGERGWSTEGKARIEGALTHGGDQVQFQIDTEADIHEPDNAYAVDGTMEIIITLEDEIYLYLHALSVLPSGNLFRPDLIGRFANRWWVLPAVTAPGADPIAIAPDPKLLNAQSQVVSVQKDLGIESINGRDAYRYAVTIDQEKLLQYLSAVARERGDTFDPQEVQSKLQNIDASGELWIDATEFWMHRIVWNITMPFRDSTGEFDFTVTLRGHNQEWDLRIPEDAEVFSSHYFLGAPSGIDGPPAADPVLPTSSQDLQKSIIDQIIRDMSIE